MFKPTLSFLKKEFYKKYLLFEFIKFFSFAMEFENTSNSVGVSIFRRSLRPSPARPPILRPKNPFGGLSTNWMRSEPPRGEPVNVLEELLELRGVLWELGARVEREERLEELALVEG